MRAAVDEAARAGATVDSSAADCEQRARDVLGGLLGGGAGRAVTVSCHEVAGAMHAQAQVALGGWVPGIPTWTFTVDGTVVKEQEP